MKNYLKCFCVAILSDCVLVACSQEAVDWNEVSLAENVFFDSQNEFRSDTIEIPLFANSALEYKLVMGLGQSVSFSWKAVNLEDPDLLLVEFHGHTIRTSDAPGDVMFYKRGRYDSSSGYMVAPFDGIHGWYFSNETNSDISIILEMSGFYEIDGD